MPTIPTAVVTFARQVNGGAVDATIESTAPAPVITTADQLNGRNRTQRA
jgi:hypothetical protein